MMSGLVGHMLPLAHRHHWERVRHRAAACSTCAHRSVRLASTTLSNAFEIFLMATCSLVCRFRAELPGALGARGKAGGVRTPIRA